MNKFAMYETFPVFLFFAKLTKLVKKKKYKNLSETLTNANGKYPLQYPIIPFSRYICFAVLRNVVGLLPTCCFVVKFLYCFKTSL